MIRRVHAVLGVLFAVASLGCGGPLPDPRILGVEPSTVEQGDAPEVLIDLDAVYPYSVDYGAEQARIATDVVARIGGVPLIEATVTESGDIRGIVPLALSDGAHDVSVSLADGRDATLAGAFTVTPGAFPDSFTIDPIPNQLRNQPFEITIRGVGGRASEFDGVVQLMVSRGSIDPAQSGRFTAGVRVQTVSLTAINDAAVITVEDAAGHRGTSNPFRVSN